MHCSNWFIKHNSSWCCSWSQLRALKSHWCNKKPLLVYLWCRYLLDFCVVRKINLLNSFVLIVAITFLTLWNNKLSSFVITLYWRIYCIRLITNLTCQSAVSDSAHHWVRIQLLYSILSWVLSLWYSCSNVNEVCYQSPILHWYFQLFFLPYLLI